MIRVGDRLLVDDVAARSNGPSYPLRHFRRPDGGADWISRFRDARTGPVSTAGSWIPGTIEPGDPVEWTSAPADNISLAEMVEDVYASAISDERVRRALASPIAERAPLRSTSHTPVGVRVA